MYSYKIKDTETNKFLDYIINPKDIIKEIKTLKETYNVTKVTAYRIFNGKEDGTSINY